jgi:two-component system response regulator FlrC
VRELENAMQRALLLSDGDLIEPNDIELHGSAPAPAYSAPSTQMGTHGTPLAYSSDTESTTSGAQDMDSIEREHILKVLKQVGGNRKDAVNILGLSERALRYKLKAYKEAGFLFE